MSRIAFLSAAKIGGLALSALVVFGAASPVLAQDGLVMRNIFGKLGFLPEEKDPIVYRERPALVVPKDLGKLRQPEKPEQHTSNKQWPVDPDAVERERERQRRNAPVFVPTASDPENGGRLSLKELAAGRTAKGTPSPTDYRVPRNDKDGVKLDIHEMHAAGKLASTPSYPPGTEPPRVYLTDPPKGLRIPSASAPSGKRTSDAPVIDTFNKIDAWSQPD